MAYDEPRIYVACLASYNNGRLHGEWIDATDCVEDMQEEVNRILRSSPYPNVMVQCPECFGHGGREAYGRCDHCKNNCEVPSAEEWAIHDYEGLGPLGEYSGLAAVAARVALVEVADEHNIPLAVLLDAMAEDDDDPEAFIQDRYAGCYSSWADYAEELHTDCGDLESVPEWLQSHIDWQSVGREMEHSMSGYRSGGDLYIFHSN